MRKLTIGMCLAVAGIGVVVAIRSASASGRVVTATWVTDPTFCLNSNYQNVVVATATSDTGTDCTIHVWLQDPNGQDAGGFECSNDPSTPFSGTDDPVIFRSNLVSYPSGTVFSVKADFKDASGTVVATQSVSFTKP